MSHTYNTRAYAAEQRALARFFLERGATFLPSFPKPSGEYQFEFEIKLLSFLWRKDTQHMPILQCKLKPQLGSRAAHSGG